MQQYQLFPVPRNYVTNCVFPCYKFEKIESIYLLYMMITRPPGLGFLVQKD